MGWVTETEINELLQLYRSGNTAAGEQLLIQLRPLVKAMVRRYANAYHEADDLEQVGYIGLLKAIERYNPSAGAKLTTFAVKWIVGEILIYLRRGHDLLKGPSPGKIANNLTELAEMNGVSREEAAASMEYPLQLIFPGEEKMAVIASERSYDEEVIHKTWLKEALLTLNPEERKVIFYRYFEEKSQQEVAHTLGFSQKQVSRLERKVLQKMKETMEEENLNKKT